MSNDGRVTDAPDSPAAPGAGPGDAPVRDVEPPLDRRSLVLAVTGLGASVLIAIMSVVPAPFAIGGPGPTFDTLSEIDGVPLVSIEGAPTYDASGELRLTTVSVARGSSSPFTLGRVIRGWLSDSNYVVPEEDVFGTPDQQEAFEEQSAQAWVTSQESATVAALEALDQPVPAELTVADIDATSHASGVLEPGDVIVGAGGAEVETFRELSAALEPLEPGDDVTVTYVRGDVQETATFATLDDGAGGAIMGIWIDPAFEIPIDVTVQIDSVGGPSAGLMFSLGIMDLLTSEDELNDARVAGTGTIDASGDVGPIGGIVMKMHGAVDDGAEHFLSPVENCPEVLGNVPAGLDVYSVDTIDDAYVAIRAIGAGETDALPTCRAP